MTSDLVNEQEDVGLSGSGVLISSLEATPGATNIPPDLREILIGIGLLTLGWSIYKQLIGEAS